MLRFITTLTFVLGVFAIANANVGTPINLDDECLLEEMAATKAAPIDPVVRKKLLKECSALWSISYLTLEDAYAHKALTITETTYQGARAYDVLFDGNFACILENL